VQWNSLIDRLYPFQDEVLGVITGLETDFHLTGGAAASRAYLGHRFSDDLDLFVVDWRVIRWIDAPYPPVFLGDLRRLGEELLQLPPPA
jgi:hypothetical protein